MHLEESSPTKQTELGELFGIEPYAMSGLLTDLQFRRYVIRERWSRQTREIRKPNNKWKHRERISVRHEVHAVTRRIVEQAKRAKAVIVIGDLKGIRGQDRGRSLNRRLSSQPFYLFKQLLM